MRVRTEFLVVTSEDEMNERMNDWMTAVRVSGEDDARAREREVRGER